MSEFLYIFTKTSYFINCLIRENKSTMYPAVSDNDIKNVNIFLPNIKFQSSIASLVNKSYTLRQSADTLYKEAENILLEELGFKDYQIKNQKCFVKNLSDTQKVSRIDAEYFQPKYEDLINKIKEYKGGYKTLENFIEQYSTGFAYKSEKYQTSGIPLIRITNIGKNKLELENNPVYISNEYANVSKKDIAKSGNILISMSGTIGNTCEIPDNIELCCINQRVLSIKTKNIHNKYLTTLLNSVIGSMQFERMGVGGLQINLSYNDIKNLLIPLLPESIQSTISAKLQQSFLDRQESLDLLAVAKGAVEVAVEDGEDVAFGYIDNNL